MGPAINLLSHRNNAGFTLIEVMVSIIILMIGMLGLLEALSLASHQVIRNGLRTEAVHLAESQMVELKNKPYVLIVPSHTTMPSKIRGAVSNYFVNMSSVNISPAVSKELIVKVAWTYKNMITSHEIHSIRICDDKKESCQ